MSLNIEFWGFIVFMLEANIDRQDEFNIKKQEVNTLAISKSNGKLISSLPTKMCIPPVTYGFVLDSDYADVCCWVYSGKIPKNKTYLAGILNIDGPMIERWVKFNEAHHRMIEDTEKTIVRPFLGYMEFCDQCLRVEQTSMAF